VRAILTVFGKEFRENLRERRTLISALILGPLLGPLLFAGGLSLRIERGAEEGERPITLAVAHGERAPKLLGFLRQYGVRVESVDYDDAAHCKYERWPVLRKKIARLMAAAEMVVVGNNHLAGYARKFTPHVTVIPTVVDLAAYPNHQDATPSSTIRIAWIGTPMTANYLKPLIPELERLQTKHPNVGFRFIGAGSLPTNGLRIESREWSAATEGQLLSECDIGIMPLCDTEFTRGKCGLKLIQYMACGLPVVASPVGVNRKIVEENRNGFLAANSGEWFKKLEALVENAELRRRLGESGRSKVAAEYTVEQGLAKWLKILEKRSQCSEQQPEQIEETISAHG